jgi:hypothetical protein
MFNVTAIYDASAALSLCLTVSSPMENSKGAYLHFPEPKKQQGHPRGVDCLGMSLLFFLILA